MSLDEYIKELGLKSSFKESALNWFIPLSELISVHQKNASQPVIIGITGCQGSGKSTLANFLAHYLNTHYQINTVSCSLDDFYLSQKEREKLAKQVHPLLKTRGVPGTHNLDLLEQVLLHVKQSTTLTPLAIPRFNKATDNPMEHGDWQIISSPVQVLIIEGWCWGIPAQNEKELAQPINDLEKEHDADGTWRRYVNTKLQHEYEPLYSLSDKLFILKAPSFNTVYQWRLEQEQQLKQTHSNIDATNIMSETEIARFIQFFQRITEHGLNSAEVNFSGIFDLDNTRKIIAAKGLEGF